MVARLGEYPKTVPQIIPDREEGGTTELADGRRDTNRSKRRQNQIINYPVDYGNNQVAASSPGAVFS